VRHRAVAITGLGPITSIGTGADSFWAGALSGRSGVKVLDVPWIQERKEFQSRIGAPVVDPEPAEHRMEHREARLLDPATRLAIAAAGLALEDAGLSVDLVDERKNQFEVDGLDGRRAGVILGTGIGGLCTVERSHTKWVLGQPLTGPTRFALPMLIPNAIPAQVAIKFGLRGECKAVATACASGTMAIGDAFRLIRDGELDLVVCGGVDKTLSDEDGYSLIGFDLLKTMSRNNDSPDGASRPFDVDRDGFVLGEGAGIVVLESEEQARARGARVYAQIAGYMATCDAHSMVALRPSGEEIERVMRGAVESADVSLGDVAYVNAHGTSTRLNDPTESKALRALFGRHLAHLQVSSTKSMTGHCIGAAGGIEAITAALTLRDGIAHRCVNLDVPDPECDVPLPRVNTAVRRTAALSNSFAFGGHNACLVMTSA
jgi:3-oxoacyl-[acyl-carrier-protein] synthase II